MSIENTNENTENLGVKTNVSFLLSIDLGDNIGELNFNSIADYKKFIEKEKEQWEFLSTLKEDFNYKNIYEYLINTYDFLYNAIKPQRPDSIRRDTKTGEVIQIKSPPPDLNPWYAAMNSIFVTHKIPLSNSKISLFIQNLSEKSPKVAAAALATWISKPGVDWTDFEQVKGALLMVAFDANITNENLELTEKKLNTLNADFSQTLTQSKSEIQKNIGEIRDLKEQYIADVKKSVNRKYRAWRRFRISKTDEIKTLIKQSEQAEKGFREQMKLKAPVKYWSDKAEKHRTSAAKFRNILMWFSGAAGLVLILCLSYIANHVVEIATNEKPAAAYLTLVTLGVVLTTIVFWAARIIMRLFLSEHHLAIDAEERSVMTETYLALTADGQASETDRTIILSSLFRPTADGIVKDDAAPDLSPASLISRLASK